MASMARHRRADCFRRLRRLTAAHKNRPQPRWLGAVFCAVEGSNFNPSNSGGFDAETSDERRNDVLGGWLPAPAVVVLANYALATTGHPRCSVVAITTFFARLVAIAPVRLRRAA
jgi:hypothetical protein